MGRIDNLKSSSLAVRDKQLTKTTLANPLGYASVSEGRTHFRGEESILVSGSGRVSGTLNVDGTIEVFGPDGQVIIHGTLHSDGAVTFDNTLVVKAETTLGSDGAETHIVGPANLDADLSVADAGRVLVGTSMVIDPTENGGAVIVGDSKLAGVEGFGLGLFSTAGATASVADGSVTAGVFTGDDLTGLSVDGSGWSLRGSGEMHGPIDLGSQISLAASSAPPGVTVVPLGLGSDGRLYTL
ncbi:hypothetical protein BH09ACT6_BH09ACT6_18660 [soil metagenome]